MDGWMEWENGVLLDVDRIVRRVGLGARLVHDRHDDVLWILQGKHCIAEHKVKVRERVWSSNSFRCVLHSETTSSQKGLFMIPENVPTAFADGRGWCS